MFGMEKNKDGKKKTDDYLYDLEKDLKDGTNMRQFKQKTDERVQTLKSMLRQGEDKKQFDDAQVLLHAYLAMQKVVQRLNRK